MSTSQRFHDRVRVDIADHIARVVLDRPDKLNALDPAMFSGLIEAGDWIKTRSDIRVVVMSGEGRMFSAGLDFMSFSGMADGDGAPTDLRPRTHGLVNTPQKVAWVWRELDIPVIAAIQGGALGGGLQIILGADIRLVAPDATLSIAEIRWGLVPDMSGCAILPGLVRADVLAELTYTGRNVSGEEAVALGLATRVETDPLAAAEQMAREIASKSPSAILHGKRLLEMAYSADTAAILQAESDAQQALIGQPHQVEAVMAQLEKRPPEFS